MTARTRLSWYAVACLSLLLTAVGAAVFGQQIVAGDRTYITIGIAATYMIATTWIGVAIHIGRPVPSYWASYLVGLFPSLGLVGTVIGIITLFGVHVGAVNDGPEGFYGLATALFTTLAGLTYSMALELQLRVLEQ